MNLNLVLIYSHKLHFRITGAWLFTRSKHENLGEILTRKEDCNILLHVEKQGESIAFRNDNQGFYTTSEGKNPPIYYYAFQN